MKGKKFSQVKIQMMHSKVDAEVHRLLEGKDERTLTHDERQAIAIQAAENVMKGELDAVE